MGMEYRAEVPLKLEVRRSSMCWHWKAADGIITNADGVTVDEIKCMYTDVTRFEEPILCTRHRRCVMRIFMHCRTD